MRLNAACLFLLASLGLFFACAQSPQTLGFLSSDAGDVPDVVAVHDAQADQTSPSFGDSGLASPACQMAASNKTAVGCEFFTMTPDAAQFSGSCYAAFISNGGSSDVTISVDIAGAPVTDFADFVRTPTGSGLSLALTPLGGKGNVLPAGKVAILFLSGSFNQDPETFSCPTGVNPPVTVTDTSTRGTGVTPAFHITTDSPVTAYDMFPYGGGQSAITAATLLIPAHSWGTNYVAVTPIDESTQDFGGSPWIGIVGSQDGTEVSIRPTSDIVGGGTLAGAAAGAVRTYKVDRGQVLEFLQNKELVGSTIQSTNPVGVFGGATCVEVPDYNTKACDSIHQQIPPVHALGSEYVYSRYRDRYTKIAETPPVRIVGAVDGTTLTYDPAAPAGAPTTLKAQQMVQFNASDSFTVRSQDDKHPFYIAAFMTGCSGYATIAYGGTLDAGDEEGGSEADSSVMSQAMNDCRGDPEFVNLVPPGEFVPEYTFFTDPTYPETELVVVRQKGQSGFADVQLDCLSGNVTGWTDVGTEGKYQVARVDLVTGNFQKVGSCDNGQHQMSSTVPFGVTVWGWGSGATGGGADPNTERLQWPYSQCVSYAYPAGMSIAAINSVVVQ
jgi:hypothetical protein